MSDIGEVIEQLHLVAARADDLAGIVHRAQSALGDTRDRMQRVLADSQAEEVSRAHGVSAAAVGHLASAAQATMQAGDIARHRAATL